MRRTRRTGGEEEEREEEGGGRGGGGRKRIRREEEEVRKRRTTMRTTNMMTVFAIQSSKFQIPLILVSWLGLHYLSKVIPHILINVLLTGTFRHKNLLVRTVSATNGNM